MLGQGQGEAPCESGSRRRVVSWVDEKTTSPLHHVLGDEPVPEGHGLGPGACRGPRPWDGGGDEDVGRGGTSARAGVSVSTAGEVPCGLAPASPGSALHPSPGPQPGQDAALDGSAAVHCDTWSTGSHETVGVTGSCGVGADGGAAGAHELLASGLHPWALSTPLADPQLGLHPGLTHGATTKAGSDDVIIYGIPHEPETPMPAEGHPAPSDGQGDAMPDHSKLGLVVRRDSASSEGSVRRTDSASASHHSDSVDLFVARVVSPQDQGDSASWGWWPLETGLASPTLPNGARPTASQVGVGTANVGGLLGVGHSHDGSGSPPVIGGRPSVPVSPSAIRSTSSVAYPQSSKHVSAGMSGGGGAGVRTGGTVPSIRASASGRCGGTVPGPSASSGSSPYTAAGPRGGLPTPLRSVEFHPQCAPLPSPLVVAQPSGPVPPCPGGGSPLTDGTLWSFPGESGAGIGGGGKTWEGVSSVLQSLGGGPALGGPALADTLTSGPGVPMVGSKVQQGRGAVGPGTHHRFDRGTVFGEGKRPSPPEPGVDTTAASPSLA